VEQLGDLAIIGGDLAGDISLPPRLDALVHAAARSPGEGVTVEQIVRDNVTATHRLVTHAKRAGVQTTIFFSSLSVYGQIRVSVVDESTALHSPDAYGLS
jgi:UDP-glucose 4-epimerase